ncbi:hypothetical protein [Sneathiella glossodoripedis]|uniref:hypothetical protein n=1 Tax=Sneathiella glossodoripedis TaxID=418853 RepID=UPI0011DD192C|nr:hypothetical protein [Sneathiella glossodoripedis]
MGAIRTGLSSFFAVITLAGFANAATLDFSEITSDPSTATSITLSNATLTHYDTNGGYLYLPDFGASTDSTNGHGSICAMAQSNCLGSMTITFNQDIQNLEIGFRGADAGDEVFVSGWNNGALTNFTNITSDGIVDFSFFGIIDEIKLFNDSAHSGLLYQDFTFDYVNSEDVIATPLPAAFPMFAAALLFGVYLRIRR